MLSSIKPITRPSNSSVVPLTLQKTIASKNCTTEGCFVAAYKPKPEESINSLWELSARLENKNSTFKEKKNLRKDIQNTAKSLNITVNELLNQLVLPRLQTSSTTIQSQVTYVFNHGNAYPPGEAFCVEYNPFCDSGYITKDSQQFDPLTDPTIAIEMRYRINGTDDNLPVLMTRYLHAHIEELGSKIVTLINQDPPMAEVQFYTDTVDVMSCDKNIKSVYAYFTKFTVASTMVPDIQDLMVQFHGGFAEYEIANNPACIKPPAASSSSLSDGAKLGIGIGVVAFVAIVGCVVYRKPLYRIALSWKRSAVPSDREILIGTTRRSYLNS